MNRNKYKKELLVKLKDLEKDILREHNLTIFVMKNNNTVNIKNLTFLDDNGEFDRNSVECLGREMRKGINYFIEHRWNEIKNIEPEVALNIFLTMFYDSVQ